LHHEGKAVSYGPISNEIPLRIKIPKRRIYQYLVDFANKPARDFIVVQGAGRRRSRQLRVLTSDTARRKKIRWIVAKSVGNWYNLV